MAPPPLPMPGAPVTLVRQQSVRGAHMPPVCRLYRLLRPLTFSGVPTLRHRRPCARLLVARMPPSPLQSPRLSDRGNISLIVGRQARLYSTLTTTSLSHVSAYAPPINVVTHTPTPPRHTKCPRVPMPPAAAIPIPRDRELYARPQHNRSPPLDHCTTDERCEPLPGSQRFRMPCMPLNSS